MADRKHRRVDEYEVGYGKPPKATQFQPGQSGNPKGRPKGRKNFATEFEEVMQGKVAVHENGRQKQMSTQRALILTALKKALGGDVKAMNLVAALARQFQRPEDADQAQVDKPLSSDEQAILNVFADEVLRKASIDTTPPPRTRHRSRPKRHEEVPS